MWQFGRLVSSTAMVKESGFVRDSIKPGVYWCVFFHVVEIVGTTCELVGTSRVCFNHVVRSRACACTNVQRDASRHCRHYVIVLFHVVTCSTDAEPVCRAFLSSLLCRLLVITRKSRDCSVTWLQVVKVVTPWLSRVPSRDHKLWSD